MEIIEFRLKKGNAFEVVKQLPKTYYWRFYKDAFNQVYLMYTYFDEVGFEYNTLIPIYAKNQKTLKVRVCKHYFEKFVRDPNLFYYIVEDIINNIKGYITEIENVELE